ncbi:MAG: PLP-dependent aminotransferase family protein [Vicinamibacterales bacterium]
MNGTSLIPDLDGDGPRYQQLTRALSAAIRDGRLQPGTRVPASRALAREHGLSRNIVLLAHDRPGGGLFRGAAAGRHVRLARPRPAHRRRSPRIRIDDSPAPLRAAGARLVRLSEGAQAVTRRQVRPRIDFMYGLCAPDARMLPHLTRAWARALAQSGNFLYGQAAGDDRLRAELARRLHAARGIARGPESLIVTSGAQQALDLCARLLLAPGDAVVVEDPGYEAARAAFAASGATVVPVTVDREGLDPDRLPRGRHRVRLVYVTPSHQFPTGAILSAARRQALLSWAHRHGAHVVEDDYDGDLRFGGAPIKALAASDAHHAVIYCGTFAKALFPSLRLGYLSLPQHLASSGASVKWLLDRGTSTLLQHVVADLMASGEYDRHLRRMHRRYAARRAVLVRTLHERLGTDVIVSGDTAGLHLVAWLPTLPASAADELESACLARGVAVYSIARHALRPLRRAGIMLGYGLLDEDAIEEGVRVLAAAVKRIRTRTG